MCCRARPSLRRLPRCARRWSALERSFAYGRVVREGFRLAIVGRPNAGKSSLFNRLVERERAIVTATPGTTRDLVTETVAIDGIPVELVDTAGLREAADEAERMGVAEIARGNGRCGRGAAGAGRCCGDGGGRNAQEDRAVLERCEASGSAVLVAWNKWDLVGEVKVRGRGSRFEGGGGGCAAGHTRRKSQEFLRCAMTSKTLRHDNDRALRHDNDRALRNDKHEALGTSALTGEGIAELRAAIVAAVAGADAGGLREAGMLTNLRQHQAVAAALSGLDAASAAVAAQVPHEMVLLDLYQALGGLDALTGTTTPEDMLRLIFSQFCIGK